MNGKIYIGITGRKPEDRWQNGKGYKYNTHFWNAIQKYGWDGFEHVILNNNLTKEEARLKEIEYIKLYNTTNQDKGYNLKRGGDLSTAPTVKQYDRFSGEFLYEWDCTVSAEKSLGIPNADISAVCNGIVKTAHDFYFSYEYLGEYLPSSIYEWINTNDCYTPVAQYDLSGNFIQKFNSIVDARSFLGLKDNEYINLNNKTSRGYIWKRLDKNNPKYVEKLSDEEIRYINVNGQSNTCFQYNLDGTFIRSFNSTTEASKLLNMSQTCIASACRKESFQSYNYLWRYECDGYIYGENLPNNEIKFIHKLSKPVYQYRLNGKLVKKYDSITEAAKEMNMATTNISKACNGTIKTAKGYIWRYNFVEFSEDELIKILSNKRKRKVDQYNMNMDYIARYESIAEAARITGISDSTITQCCNGKYKHAGNFKWKYVS